MKKSEKFAYFYNKANRTESLGVITTAHNWGEPKNEVEAIVQKMLPKRYEDFFVLEVKNQAPFGAVLADMLSIDFAQAVDFFKTRALGWQEELTEYDLDLLPRDIRFLASQTNKILGKNILEDVKRIYLVRKYVEMCMERPWLYSFGQFQRLSETVYEQGWHPRAIGFFAPIDVLGSERYFLSVENFRKADYYGGAHDLLELDTHLERTLLDRYGRDCLPDATIEVFEISNAVDAALLSLFHLIHEQVTIKKCGNCGKLFFPLLRSDAVYCDRAAPQDGTKTCKEYGSKVLWHEKIMNDDVARLARNVYSAKQMLVKRNPNKSEYAEMFEHFKQERNQWEKQIKSGTKTREEYAEWLRKMKLCKTLSELEES